ncbi:MAG: class I SAM-dependent methyltransferase [Gammaproteobacteria bacterium]
MTFKDHFSSLAAQYAEFRPRYPGALFDFLAKTAPAKHLAWDCACGSGQASVDLAERFEAVVATDASAQQIAVGKPHPRVTYSVARAEESGLEGNAFDLITVAQALHWFDLPRFYAEVTRVLHPGGVLAVWTYGLPRVNDANLDRVLQTYYWETVGEFWTPERKHVESGYRMLPFPFDEISGPSLSMRENWNLTQLLGYIRSWSATKRFADARGEDPVVGLTEQFASLWGDVQRARDVSWPLSLRLGRR